MYDAIIIGSGIGSLTTAGLLARAAGARVLVLEQHTTPGGLTHSFRRLGATWDVGVHYVGDMEPGSRPRQLMDYLTEGALTWNRMPAGYDRFYLPGHGLDVTIPAGADEYQRLLTSLFPHEKKAIRRYCRDVKRAYSWMSLHYAREMVPPRAAPAVRLTQRALAGHALERTQHYMERRFRDPALRSLLTTHWGDYGVEPSRSAFVAHAMIVGHYMNGAWFPRGGSAQIARMIEKGIVGAGGRILLAHEVDQILVEDGAAVGVRVTDHSGTTPLTYEERAPIIISGIGARETYQHLLPTTGPTGGLTARVREQIASLGHGGSAVTVYLTLDHYPQGMTGANVWINTDTGLADPARMTAGLLDGHPRSAFISFPAIKSGEPHATAEIVSFVMPEAFERWAGTRPKERGRDYEALTSSMARALIDLAESAVPGLKHAVRYVEVGTPLTVEHYTSHEGGCFYGLPLTPERFHADLGTPSTPITNLILTGQDAGMPGIVGAAMAGLSAACKALGPAGYPRINRALRHSPTGADAPRTPTPQPRGDTGADRHRARVERASWITPTIRDITLCLPTRATWEPGQYALVRVAPYQWRPYSIATPSGRIVRLLVDTRTRGHGAAWATHAAHTDEVTLELPYGHFLHDAATGDTHPDDTPRRRRIFVATGTGIAPFLAEFEQGLRADDVLLLGLATTSEDPTTRLDTPLPRVIRCVSREDAPGCFHGRVTHYLRAHGIDPHADYYVCGSPLMVADVARLIRDAGGRVHTESF